MSKVGSFIIGVCKFAAKLLEVCLSIVLFYAVLLVGMFALIAALRVLPSVVIVLLIFFGGLYAFDQLYVRRSGSQ
jgi:ABC-type arginine transport system permease subunit